MIDAPSMLMVGSGGRNSGKTDLACLLIRRFCKNHELAGVKVTTVNERGGECPRGGQGCGACTSLEGAYCLSEEVNAGREKDTQRLLAAGARRVYWLRVLKTHLREGAAALLETIGAGTAVICESNSLRTVVEPGVFLMVCRRDGGQLKRSAQAVQKLADRLVVSDGQDFDLALDSIDLVGARWAIRLPAAAVILAGGESKRMGRDKSLLPIDGRAMIEQISAQLSPHFERLLVSANAPQKYAFLNIETVPDEIPGQGPLMGIASALRVSQHDLNLVVACDIPEVNMAVIKGLLRQAEGHDGVVPVTGAGRIEPLLAVYRRRMLGAINATLRAGKRKISDALDLCNIKYVGLAGAEWLWDLNTREDYADFIGGGRTKDEG